MRPPLVLVPRSQVVWVLVGKSQTQHACRIWRDNKPDSVTLCGREGGFKPATHQPECRRCAGLLEPA